MVLTQKSSAPVKKVQTTFYNQFMTRTILFLPMPDWVSYLFIFFFLVNDGHKTWTFLNHDNNEMITLVSIIIENAERKEAGGQNGIKPIFCNGRWKRMTKV